MRLYPRLSRRFAEDIFRQQSMLLLEELTVQAATNHPLQTWPATGAARIDGDELAAIRDAVRDAAREHGWPSPLERSRQRAVDVALARVLWRTELTPAEAGFGDVWSFLALVLIPDIVWWRAAGSTNVERFVGTDLTRHTLARLWWRAHLFTWGLADSEEGWALWRDTDIGEADLDQIQTRRGGYGRSPKVFRSLVRLYPHVTALAVEGTGTRRDLWRQEFLRWLLRLGAFTDFNALDDDELDQDLAAVADALAASAPTGVPGAADGIVDSRATALPGDFDAQPLRTIVVRITEAVRQRGRTPEDKLCEALEEAAGITVPPERHEVIRGIAWQGKALRYLDRSDDHEVPMWFAGSVLPAEDRRWGDWTVESFKQHVAGLKTTPTPQELAAELFTGRAGRTIKRIVHSALRETQRKA